MRSALLYFFFPPVEKHRFSAPVNAASDSNAASPSSSGATILHRRTGARIPSGWGCQYPAGPAFRLKALASRLAVACGIGAEDERPLPAVNSESPETAHVTVSVPQSRATRRLIDLWAGYVAVDGTPLESQLLVRYTACRCLDLRG